MSKFLVICKHCGGTPEAHHDFEPQMPEGCVCNPVEWMALLDGTISTPCKAFVEQPDDDTCARCEHDRECHVPPWTPERLDAKRGSNDGT